MTQVARFSTGGYVLHKLMGNVSAWLDDSGALLNAEAKDRLGRFRPVKRGGPQWERVESGGRVYAEPKGAPHG